MNSIIIVVGTFVAVMLLWLFLDRRLERISFA